MQENNSQRYGLAAASGKKGKVKRTKVLVALRGFGNESVRQSSTATQTTYAGKRAEYASRKENARTKQAEVIAWLDANKTDGSWKKVSAPTAFGTFTLEATDDIIALLNRAPGIESVLPTDEAPMTLLAGATPAATP